MKNRIDQALSDCMSDDNDSSFGPPRAGEDCFERNRAEAFLALHAHNHARLSAYVHTIVPSWQDAEEIIQDTLLVLWRKFDDFDPATNFFAWAARVAQYEVLNHRRKNKRRVVVLDDDVIEAIGTTAAKHLEDLDLRRESLEHCINKLPLRDRKLVNLRYQDGGDIQAAANAVNRSTGHVQRLLGKIRSQLLRCIRLQILEVGK